MRDTFSAIINGMLIKYGIMLKSESIIRRFLILVYVTAPIMKSMKM